MTKISAELLAHSKGPMGDELMTFKLTFPRFILAELNTHRMFSKNSASSRAIPFRKLIAAVETDPFIPIAYQKEHIGMQGTEYFSKAESEVITSAWLHARDSAVKHANDLGGRIFVTKQLVNRLLEPFLWHTVILTTGKEGLENFFELRCPQYEVEETKERCRSRFDYKCAVGVRSGEFQYPVITDEEFRYLNKGQAEIHMMELAESMWDVYRRSQPKILKSGEWHIPYFDKIDRLQLGVYPGDSQELVLKIATAMIARVSFTVVGDEKEFGYDKQIALYDRMAQQKPFHASPFEHCAQCMDKNEYSSWGKRVIENGIKKQISGYSEFMPASVYHAGWCRNYCGFRQLRDIIESEK